MFPLAGGGYSASLGGVCDNGFPARARGRPHVLDNRFVPLRGATEDDSLGIEHHAIIFFGWGAHCNLKRVTHGGMIE